MAQSKTTTLLRKLRLSQRLAQKADQRAAQLGLSTPQYICSLITQDSRHPTIPTEKISAQAEKRYFKDFIQFLQSEAKNPTPGFTSAQELMRHLAGDDWPRVERSEPALTKLSLPG